MTTPDDRSDEMPDDVEPDENRLDGDQPEPLRIEMGPLDADDPVRGVFRRALRDMLVLVGVVAVLGIGIGALVAPTPAEGIWGAAIGVCVALVFSGTTVLSMLWTAGSSATTTGAVVLGAWLAKMIVLVALFAVLDDHDFYDRGVLVGVVLVAVLGSVLLDYRAVSRGRVPYVDARD